jgi:hypothetical protein
MGCTIIRFAGLSKGLRGVEASGRWMGLGHGAHDVALPGEQVGWTLGCERIKNWVRVV